MQIFTKKLLTFLLILPVYSCSNVQPNQVITPLTIEKSVVNLKAGSIILKGKIFEVQKNADGSFNTVPIEGAKIELSDKSTLSGKDGSYSLPEITFGKYYLKVIKDGFEAIDDPTYNVNSNISHLDVSLTRLENVGQQTVTPL